MDFAHEIQRKNKERQALRSLEEISNQTDTPMHTGASVKVKKRKKEKIFRYKKQHHQSADLQNIKNSKSQKLPFIPSKPNFESTVKMKDQNSKTQNFIMFEKGLGSFGSVHIKKDGIGRYVDSNNKFMKFYSQSNQQEIELIKMWLQAKKQSWRSVNSFFHKKKAVSQKNSVNKHLQIRNIL